MDQQNTDAPIQMKLTLNHALILAQFMDQAMQSGIPPMSMKGTAVAPGDEGYMPSSMVAQHLAEVGVGLHKAIQETIARLQQQQQAKQMQEQMQNSGMFGHSAPPQGQQQHFPQPTSLDAPGVSEVPLSQENRVAPMIMPGQPQSPTGQQRPNGSASGVNPNEGSGEG